MSDASFTHVAAPANEGPAFETRCFDADDLRTSHGIDASASAYVEVQSGTRLYSLVVAHLGKAASCSFTPRVVYNKQSLMDEIFSDNEPSKSVVLDMGLGVTKISHAIDGVEHTITAVHQRRGPIVGSNCGATTWENLVLFVAGRENRGVLTHLLQELLKKGEETGESQFSIWTFKVKNEYWDHLTTKVARSLDSVVLPAATKEQLIKDVDAFLSPDTYRFYTSHGIPYKRAYLFHGVPGAGKTSFLQALAGKYRRNLCILQPTDPQFTDEKLQTAVQDAPNRSIIVLEDVDALFAADRSKKDGASSITFSGLLNALDGVANPEGQIFILSTNHRERLDPALIRNGRVDLHVEFSHATAHQMEQIFLQFYPDASAEAATRFREAVLGALGERKINMAALQHYFIGMMRASSEEAIAGVAKIVKDMEDKRVEGADEAAAKDKETDGGKRGSKGTKKGKAGKSGKAKRATPAGAIHVHIHTGAAAASGADEDEEDEEEADEEE